MPEIKKKILQKKYILPLFCLAVLLIAGIFLLTYKSEYREDLISVYGDTAGSEIISEAGIIQRLPLPQNADEAAFSFCTGGRINKGTLIINIKGEQSGKIYLDEKIDISLLPEKEFYSFALSEPADGDTDDYLLISFASDSNAGEGIMLYTSEEDNYLDCDMQYGEEIFPEEIAVRFIAEHKAGYLLDAFRNISIIMVVLAGLILIWFVIKNPLLPKEKIFAVLLAVFGSFYIIFITPLSPPDELFHYSTAYELSNYMMFDFENADMCDAEDFDFNGYKGHSNVASAYERLMAEGFDRSDAEAEKIELPESRGLSYFVQNIPPAIGIILARLIGFNSIWTFISGRITNLAFFIVCVYFAIKKTPRFKALFGIIALFPMTIHQAASYSSDSFINGMSFLLTAYIFKALFAEERISKKEIAVILLSAVLLAPAKIIYAALILLLFFIPKENIGSNKKKYIFAFAAVLLCMISVLLFKMTQITELAASSELNWEGCHNYTLSYIFEHPKNTVKIFITTLDVLGASYFNCMIGESLSGFTLNLPHIFTILFVVIAVLSLYAESPKNFDKYKRLCCIFIFAAIVGLSMLAMFLDHTSDFRPYILGVQGRYFIPAEVLFFSVFAIPMPYLEKPELYDPICISGEILLQIGALAAIILKTVVNI